MHRSSWLGIPTLLVVAVGACSADGGAEPTTSTTVVEVAPTVVEEAPVRAVVGWREVADLPFRLTGGTVDGAVDDGPVVVRSGSTDLVYDPLAPG